MQSASAMEIIPLPTHYVRVLCVFSFKWTAIGKVREETGVLMVNVVRSDDIWNEFRIASREYLDDFRDCYGIKRSTFDVRFRSYLPENGRAIF